VLEVILFLWTKGF